MRRIWRRRAWFKSDRGGIEIWQAIVEAAQIAGFKSDRGGIEIGFLRVDRKVCAEFKSDRGGIEIDFLLPMYRLFAKVQIRPWRD